jgi:hypothetical protein
MAFDPIAPQRLGDGKESMSELDPLVHGSPWKSGREGAKKSWSMAPGSTRLHNFREPLHCRFP